MTTTQNRRGLLRPTGDTGSLAMTLLLTLVGITLTALLAPIVVNQITASRVAARRADALNAAQAGIDVALGTIRAGRGSRGALPCGEQLKGTVDTANYAADVTYHLTADSPAMSCEVVQDSAQTPPALAKLHSVGDAHGLARTVDATYILKIASPRPTGGLIQLADTSLCLTATSDTPLALQMQRCSPGNANQIFVYDVFHNLYQASSRKNSSLGMCLDAGAPRTATSTVQFQPCVRTSPSQRWDLSDSDNREGTFGGDGLCFSALPTAGTAVTLAPCPGTSFTLDPEVTTAQRGGPAKGVTEK